MNVELAEQIIGLILMEPERFRMNAFYEGDPYTAGQLRSAWPCGTTACIAGHAALLTAPDDAVARDGVLEYPDAPPEAMFSVARRALGISMAMADCLFYHVNDEEAVTALKFLIGNPAADACDLAEFLTEGRGGGIGATAEREGERHVYCSSAHVAEDGTDDMLPLLGSPGS